MFGHLLLNLGGGGIDIHAIWKGVSGQARVHGGGGARGRCPPPLEIGKKMLSEEILTSFTIYRGLGVETDYVHFSWF